MDLRLDESNATNAAYREIKQRIVDLHYGVGERLSEARLVTELGLGRSPIRSALARLKGEGWVAVSPQSGTYVKALTNRDIEEVTELRLLLEMHSAADAARKISDADLKAIQQAFRRSRSSIIRGDVEAFIGLDTELHATIYAAAGNKLITEILLNLRDKVQWIRRACAVSSERVQDGFRELERIAAALDARNPKEAAASMRRHIRNAAAFCKDVERYAAHPEMAAQGRSPRAPSNRGHSSPGRPATDNRAKGLPAQNGRSSSMS